MTKKEIIRSIGGWKDIFGEKSHGKGSLAKKNSWF